MSKIKPTFCGESVVGYMEKALAEAEKKKVEVKEGINPLKSKANIDLSNYLIIPGTNSCIVKIEEDWTKGKEYEPSHKIVLERGLEVPTAAIFTSHLINIINAYNNKLDVYQADGNKISREELENIYKHLTTAHINGGAWTWLNGKFLQGSGFNNFDLETITGLDSNGNLTTKREPLLECLFEDCYVDLEFNKQGFPIKKSRKQEYVQGKNIYFWYPRENCVARYVADSGRSYLRCDRNPYYSYSSLGVRASFQRS